MLKHLVFSLVLLFALACKVEAQTPSTTTPPPAVLLEDDHQTWSDTCAFYVDFSKVTTDRTGLLMQGTDLMDAYMYTRCECNVKQAVIRQGENFIMFAVHANVLQIVPSPEQTAYRTVWNGNTTRYLLTRK